MPHFSWSIIQLCDFQVSPFSTVRDVYRDQREVFVASTGINIIKNRYPDRYFCSQEVVIEFSYFSSNDTGLCHIDWRAYYDL